MSFASPNLKIKQCNPKSHFCLVAFTSNGGNIESKFEFENLCESKKIKRFFNKLVFIRDTNRHFYINGIDDNINDVSKIIEMVKSITHGLTIRSIGYSAGGYMAILLSLFISNVDRVVAPGGVVNVLDWHGAFLNYNFSDLEIVKNASIEQRFYFDIRPMLKNTHANTFLIYANNSKTDQMIVESIKSFSNEKYHIVLFNTDKHGAYCFPFDYKYLLTLSEAKLTKINKFENKEISPFRFSITVQGLCSFLVNNIIRALRRVKRKLFK